MTEPEPIDAHQELMVAILQWVATIDSSGENATGEWDRRDVEVRPDSEGVPFVLQETSGDGIAGARGMLPPEVAQVVGTLQQAMFTPGQGTWLSAMFTVTSVGAGDVRFNHDQRPVDAETGGPGMSAEQVREHLDVFPRDAEHTPDWMTSA